MGITRLNHVVSLVGDLQNSLAFDEGELDARRIPMEVARRRGVPGVQRHAAISHPEP